MNTDRSHLGVANPNSGHSGNAPGVNIEVGKRIDQNLFDPADECAHVALPIAQIHDRICHDLPRPVISDVAAAVALMQFDSRAEQHLFRCQQIFLVPIASDCHHMWMLNEQEVIDAQPLLAFLRKLALYPERGAVAYAPEIPNDAMPAHSLRLRIDSQT